MSDSIKILIAITVCTLFISCNSNWKENVMDEVANMEIEYAETQRTGDYEKQGSLHSDDYSYIDVSGKRVTKDQVDFRRDDDMMISVGLETTEQEVIPLSPELAISRGRQEGLSIYYGGIPRVEPTRYMAIWRKEKGGWKILADQVTPIINREINKPVIQNLLDLTPFAGTFRLNTSPPIVVELKVLNDTLRLIVPGKLDEGLKFLPTYNNTFFSKQRPWEIIYHTNDSLTLNSWGQLSYGMRIE